MKINGVGICAVFLAGALSCAAGVTVENGVIQDSPLVELVEDVPQKPVSGGGVSTGLVSSGVDVGSSLQATSLQIKARYRGVLGADTKVFDVKIPVYYDSRHVLLGPREREALMSCEVELGSILDAMEGLAARARAVEARMSAILEAGRPLQVLTVESKDGKGDKK
jgi:hypothetical protein